MQKITLIAAVLATGSFAMAGNGFGTGSTKELAVSGGIPLGSVNQGEATVLYDNTPGASEGVLTTTSTPRTTGGDEFIIVGSPSQHSALLTSMQFGYSVATGGPAAFDAKVTFFDDIDYAATTGAQFLNPRASFTLNFTGQTAGAFITAPIDLTGLSGGGVTLTDNPANNDFPSGSGNSNGFIDGFFVVSFLNAGTSTNVTSNGVTFLFDSSGVNVGSSYDTAGPTAPVFGGTQADAVYWRDADGNQTIIGNEARSFAAPTRANFVLHLEGNLVPEPTSLTAVAGLGMLIRRRRA